MKKLNISRKIIIWTLAAIIAIVFFIAYNDGRNDSEKIPALYLLSLQEFQPFQRFKR